MPDPVTFRARGNGPPGRRPNHHPSHDDAFVVRPGGGDVAAAGHDAT
jgi:hypothetical protein